MKILIACESSGTVRRAFRALDHDAWSCDLLPADDGGEHIRCEHALHLMEIISGGWDLLIAHPPCKYLSVSGMHWTARGLRDPEHIWRISGGFFKMNCPNCKSKIPDAKIIAAAASIQGAKGGKAKSAAKAEAARANGAKGGYPKGRKRKPPTP